MLKRSLCLGAALMATYSQPIFAHENDKPAPHASDHAPIGVMADHRHKKGEWMVSYRYMTMDMEGSRDGTNSLTPEQIATTIPNRFSNIDGQPPTLRVIPTDMQMDMHMVGGMYGLSDRITVMAMTSYLRNDMNHLTFQGGMGTTLRGTFETSSEGFGDSTIGAIIGIDDGLRKSRQINLNLALSLPTGSNTQTDQILTPMGTTPSPRLPYPMQLGSGTYDFKPGVTYFDREGKLGWGTQLNARIPLGENKEGYKFGNRLGWTAWLSYEPVSWISFSTRLNANSQGRLNGSDPVIIAPVQTADPNNSGGDTVKALVGVNLAGQQGSLKGHRLAIEYGVPLYRKLNGPQLETDSVLTIGWQKAF